MSIKMRLCGWQSETGLTTYDASYLWLANDLGIELVTLDRRLATAVEKFR